MSDHPPLPSGSFFKRSSETEKHTRNLPHWQQGDVWCFVTWRLADSIPQSKLAEWEEEKRLWMSHHPRPWDEAAIADYQMRFPRRIEDWLDQGSGSCLLRDPAKGNIVASALRHFDGERYDLNAFVVMPNHVHVLFRPINGHQIQQILKSWKGFTAYSLNKHLKRTATVWQEEYWDRLVRSEEHLRKYAGYIAENPVKARLRRGEFILYSR